MKVRGILMAKIVCSLAFDSPRSGTHRVAPKRANQAMMENSGRCGFESRPRNLFEFPLKGMVLPRRASAAAGRLRWLVSRCDGAR